MTPKLGRDHISHLLGQNSAFAALVAKISPSCAQTAALSSETPAASAGMADFTAGVTETPGLNGPM